MRIDVRKFLFIGPRTQWGPFFEKAQEAGLIQFVEPSGKGLADVPESAQLLLNAYKVLKRFPMEPQVDAEEPAAVIAERILQLREELDAGLEEERLIFQELPRAEPYGDFSEEDRQWVEREAHLVMQFFMAKTGRGKPAEEDPHLIFVDTARGLDYYVSLSPKPRQYPGLVEIRLDRPLGVLKERLRKLTLERRALEGELSDLTRYYQYLQAALLEELDEYHLERAMQAASHPLDEQLFAVQGWVPKDHVGSLSHIFQRLSVHWEPVLVDPVDRQPTFLRNPGLKKLGEDLINIYDTPSTRDADPSFWVLVFFAIFFAMILGDGGYGFLIGSGAAIALWKARALKGMASVCYSCS